MDVLIPQLAEASYNSSYIHYLQGSTTDLRPLESSTDALFFYLTCSLGLLTANLPRARGRKQLLSHDLLVAFIEAKSNTVGHFNTGKAPNNLQIWLPNYSGDFWTLLN